MSTLWCAGGEWTDDVKEGPTTHELDRRFEEASQIREERQWKVKYEALQAQHRNLKVHLLDFLTESRMALDLDKMPNMYTKESVYFMYKLLLDGLEETILKVEKV